MPMALHSSPEAAELSPTDCSEDSIEIRLPRGIIRPHPKNASSATLASYAQSGIKRKFAPVPESSPGDEKKQRLESYPDPRDPLPATLYPSSIPPYGPLVFPGHALPLIQNDLVYLQRWLLSRDPYNPATLLHPAAAAAIPAQLQRPFPFYPPHLAQHLGSHPLLPYLPPLYPAAHPLYSGTTDPLSKDPSHVPACHSSPGTSPVPKSPSPFPRILTEAPRILPAVPKVEEEEPLSLVTSTRHPSFGAPASPAENPAPLKPLGIPVKKRAAFLSVEALLSDTRTESPPPARCEAAPAAAPETLPTKPVYREPSKSYKNLTRERRMQANARERTRVHTISAAFENLRRAVPSFSHGQRLSKLSILRVATSYIMALGKLAAEDQDDDQELTLEACVDLCTKTLMTEGQMRRNNKRDDKLCDD